MQCTLRRVAKPVGFTGFYSRFTLKTSVTADFSCAKTMSLLHLINAVTDFTVKVGLAKEECAAQCRRCEPAACQVCRCPQCALLAVL